LNYLRCFPTANHGWFASNSPVWPKTHKHGFHVLPHPCPHSLRILVWEWSDFIPLGCPWATRSVRARREVGGGHEWSKHQSGVLLHLLHQILRVSALEQSQLMVGRCPWVAKGARARGQARRRCELAVVNGCVQVCMASSHVTMWLGTVVVLALVFEQGVAARV